MCVCVGVWLQCDGKDMFVVVILFVRVRLCSNIFLRERGDLFYEFCLSGCETEPIFVWQTDVYEAAVISDWVLWFFCEFHSELAKRRGWWYCYGRRWFFPLKYPCIVFYRWTYQQVVSGDKWCCCRVFVFVWVTVGGSQWVVPHQAYLQVFLPSW